MDTGISTSAHRTQNLHSNSLINPDSNSEAPLETAQLQTQLWAGFLLFWSSLASSAAAGTCGVRLLRTPAYVINIRRLLGGLVATWQPLKTRSWQNIGTICLLYVQSMCMYSHGSAPSDIVHASGRLDDRPEILNFKAAKLTL